MPTAITAVYDKKNKIKVQNFFTHLADTPQRPVLKYVQPRFKDDNRNQETEHISFNNLSHLQTNADHKGK